MTSEPTRLSSRSHPPGTSAFEANNSRILSVPAFSRPLVILESPFAGDIDANIEYARQCITDCVRRGEAPIASHLLFTQPGILDDAIPSDRHLGVECGIAWIRRADYSVFYTDRGWSSGMLEALYEFGIKRSYQFRLRSLSNNVMLPDAQPWLNQEIFNFLLDHVDNQTPPPPSKPGLPITPTPESPS